MAKPTVGYIGLGIMGGGMARNLLGKGHPLVAYDINKDAVNQLVGLGAQAAASPRDVAEKSSIVMTSLPNPPIVKDVFLGRDGILAGSKGGSVVVEFSTIDPDTMREIAAAGREKGVEVLGAPVGGSGKDALEGKLLFWISGSSKAFEAYKEVLATMGKCLYCGEDAGTGKAVKLVNNLMAIGNLLNAIEAFTLGVKMGLKPRFLFDMLSEAGGRSQSFLNHFPKVLDGSFETVKFGLPLATKDVKLAITVANDNQVPMPIASSVLQMCLKTIGSGYGTCDLSAVAQLYEKWAGVTSKSDPGDK